VVDAIKVGTLVYDAAFEQSYKQSSSLKTRDEDSRFWVRGVIVRVADNNIELVEARTSGDLTIRRSSESLLGALSLEQGAFRGMRLLVECDLVTGDVASTVHVEIGHGKSTGRASCCRGPEHRTNSLRSDKAIGFNASEDP
jgi:hypothetical protein